jgi:endoglucanase
MISVHYYDPWDFSGAESGTITQWGRASTNPAKKSTWGQEDYMDAQLKKVYDKFVAKGYPVVVGEYGAIDKSSFDSGNTRYRADYVRTLTSTARKYGAATVYWDNGATGRYGFGLINRRTLAVTQQSLIDAIMTGSGGGGGNPGEPSGRHKIKNLATGTYLDSEANSAVILAAASTYDDQDWVLTQTSTGTWTIDNVRSGRSNLAAGAGGTIVWNSGGTDADAQWALEPVSTGGFRLNNQNTGSEYLYAATASEVRWNTGTTDASTVWILEAG